MSASKTDEMLNNDLESEFHKIAKTIHLFNIKYGKMVIIL